MVIEPHERRVLITGIGGRIGRRMAAALIARGWRTFGVARGGSFSNNAQVIKGDLSDPCVIERAFSACQDGKSDRPGPVAVVHLAGLADASEASSNRDKAFQANVELTRQLLDLSTSKGVQHFIFASTGYVYGATRILPAVEDSPVSPDSVYAETKLAAEELVRGYAAKFEMKADILRISNVYGPDSSSSTVVGRILQMARQRQPISVRSREPVRDFIYVDDVVNAFAAVMECEREEGCRVLNVSSGVGTSVGCLVDTVEALLSNALPGPCDSHCKDRLVLSNDSLKAETTWYPEYSLVSGLRACLV